MIFSGLRCLLRGLALVAAGGAVFTVSAASSVLVWPVYQVIEADQNGSALWLENRGAAPVSLQVRVFAWKQHDFNEIYADQNDVAISPPFATVAPGQRQLIRLIRNAPVAAGSEQAYRIIIDEVPSPQTPSPAENKATVGLQLQMRYLLPLFVDGEGIWTNERSDIKRDSATASQPHLTWSLQNVAGKPYLQVRNNGKVHARLSNLFWSAKGEVKQAVKTVTPGFLGYVLPGQVMRWPLPPTTTMPGSASQLNAQIADNSPPIVIDRGE